MSDIPHFPYELLWGERRICSVVNLTRADRQEFMRVASEIPLEIHVTTHPLGEANRSLADLREGRLAGAAVLSMRTDTA